MSRLVFLLLLLCAGACPAQSAAEAPASDSQVTQSEIPYKRANTKDADVSYGRVVIVMVLMLLLACGAVYLLKRSPWVGKISGVGSESITVLDFRRLSPRLTLYLVMVQGRKYLLSQCGDQVSLIEHSSDDEKIT